MNRVDEWTGGQVDMWMGGGLKGDRVVWCKVDRPAMALALLLTTLNLLLVETVEGKDLQHVRFAIILLHLLVPGDPVGLALAWSGGWPLAPPQPLILCPGDRNVHKAFQLHFIMNL